MRRGMNKVAEKARIILVEQIEPLIQVIRGETVMLDTDLAILYDVPTKMLNRQVKRNRERFPSDFCFQLTLEEFENLRCQIGTSSSYGGRRYPPYVFTEHGAIMAASVLNSSRAVEVGVFVVRFRKQKCLSRQKHLDQTELRGFDV
jgi:hypothetical protein